MADEASSNLLWQMKPVVTYREYANLNGEILIIIIVVTYPSYREYANLNGELLIIKLLSSLRLELRRST